MSMKKAKFYCMDDPTFEGFHDPDKHWNGWACPYFHREVAERAAEELVARDRANDRINYPETAQELALDTVHTLQETYQLDSSWEAPGYIDVWFRGYQFSFGTASGEGWGGDVGPHGDQQGERPRTVLWQYELPTRSTPENLAANIAETVYAHAGVDMARLPKDMVEDIHKHTGVVVHSLPRIPHWCYDREGNIVLHYQYDEGWETDVWRRVTRGDKALFAAGGCFCWDVEDEETEPEQRTRKKAEEHIAALEKEVAELRRAKQRLEWLDKNIHKVKFLVRADGKVFVIRPVQNPDELLNYGLLACEDTLNEAIDHILTSETETKNTKS